MVPVCDEVRVTRFEQREVGAICARSGEYLATRSENVLCGEDKSGVAAHEYLIFRAHAAGVGVQGKSVFERIPVASFVFVAHQIFDVNDMQATLAAFPLFWHFRRCGCGSRFEVLAHIACIDTSRLSLNHYNRPT